MKRLFEVFTAFLCVNYVSPVLMFYIYDDNPNVGFVGVEQHNAVGAYVPGYNLPKKQFTGSYSPRYQKYTNEHVVDSHFKVMKTPSRYTLSTLMDRNGVQRGADYRVTQPPASWQHNAHPGRTAVNLQPPLIHKEKTAKTIHSKPMSIAPAKDVYEQRRADQGQQQDKNKNVANIPPIRPKAVNADYSSAMKPHTRLQDETYEPKSNFVQMNVRKTQISQDAQKVVRRNQNRHPPSSTGHEISHNRHQRVPSSMLMDKTHHKTNGGLNDHNVQLMARVLDDMTHQGAERRPDKGEYRKRDIKTAMQLHEKPKRNPVSDTMRKYIGKDKVTVKDRNERKGNMEVARIGSHEESLELSNAPYALFYRMNPETLDQQEAFILMGSMEKNSSTDNIKETRQFDEFEMKKTTPRKPKSNTNSLRLHKKMRNYSSFRHQ